MNHAAVAPLSKPAADAMKHLADDCLNYGSLHYGEWLAVYDGLRKSAARLIGAEPGEIALVKNREGTVKVFGGGQVLSTAPTEAAARKLFESGVKAILRAQMCTRCNICVKNCPQHAIRIEDGPIIIEERCNQCGRCTDACVVAHYYDKLVTGKERA